MKKTLKRALVLVFAITLILALVSCRATDEETMTTPPEPPTDSPPSPDSGDESPPVESPPVELPQDGFKVGISLPTQSLPRWAQDGASMKEAFETLGYEVDLQFGGENEVPVQISQIGNMIAGGVDVLIIAATDGYALTEVLAAAKAIDIPVIAYDRLIMNTDAVTYYVAFNNFLVGIRQGEYIRDMLDLDNAEGPFNIEFFTGDYMDSNAPHFFFSSAMSILQPYLDSGVLVCPSGQTDYQQAATPGWDPANAQARMENLISDHNYRPTGGTPLHAVMCSNDSTAQGVTNALVNAGFVSGDDFPIITGQDCDIVSVRNIVAGVQSMSVFKDTYILTNQVVEMVKAIINGTEVPINDRTMYDNLTGIIPAFLCEPVVVTRENYRECLIDTGYYTEADIDVDPA